VAQPGDTDPLPELEGTDCCRTGLDDLADYFVAGDHTGPVYG
jgi:hypothetical protein